MARRLWAAFVLVLIVLTGAAAFLAHSIAKFDDERTAVSEIRGDIDALNAFLATLEDAETSQRGYLLTGDTAYLAPYESARRAIESQVAELDSLTVGDPTEH